MNGPGAHGDDHPSGPSQAGEGPVAVPGPGPFVAAAVSLFLFAALFVFPPLGVFVAPMATVPLLQLAARRGTAAPAWGGVAILLAIATLAGGGTPILLFLTGYLVLVAVPVASVELRRLTGWGDGRWAALAALAGLLLVLAAVVAATWPASPVEGTAAWYHKAGEQAVELYARAGISRGEIQLAIDRSAPLISWLLPSMPLAYLVAVLFWVRPRAELLGLGTGTGTFEEYRSDEWLPVGFVAGGLGTFFFQGTPRWVAVNLLATVLILYFVHGLAIIRAHLVRYVGRGWFVRWGIALLCLQVPLPALVAVLGLADSFFDLRPRRSDDDRRTT